MASNNDGFEYDVALSFAGENRAIVEKFATLLKSKNIKVFYDEYEAADLWGKDLIDHFVNIYSRKARYCVMFISRYYPLKKWTKVERMAAQERAFRDADEYILPIRLDDTQVPGITETTGYRDLRQHSMESIVNLLEQKLARTKGQSGTPLQSHDLRSGNIPSQNTSFGEIPLPKQKRTFTQLEQDRFAKEAFIYIKQYFQQALQDTQTHDPNLQTEFDEITNLRFKSKIYAQGNLKAQCNIWLGDNLISNTIYYNEGTRGLDDSSINTYLPVVDNGEELRLHIQQFAFTSRVQIEDEKATKQQAAEYLWRRLISHLEY
jgi:hypothetical protein